MVTGGLEFIDRTIYRYECQKVMDDSVKPENIVKRHRTYKVFAVMHHSVFFYLCV